MCVADVGHAMLSWCLIKVHGACAWLGDTYGNYAAVREMLNARASNREIFKSLWILTDETRLMLCDVVIHCSNVICDVSQAKQLLLQWTPDSPMELPCMEGTLCPSVAVYSV